MQKAQKIIISRTDNIGDVILTLPLAGFLKNKWKDIEITFIGKAYTRAIIEQCIYVDKFLDKEEIIQRQCITTLKQAELILFVFPDKAIARAAYRAKIPLRIGTSHRWIHWLYANRRVHFSRKNAFLHEAQLNFKLLQPLGFFQIPSLRDMTNYYGLILKKHASQRDFFFNSKKFNLIIHPKSKGSAREWGFTNYLKLVDLLPKEQFDIYVTGSSEEGKKIYQDIPQIFDKVNVKNTTGKFDLKDLICFIEQADGILSCSTGPLHISAALGKWTLGLYAPIRPIHAQRWAPIGKKASFICSNISCRKCRKSNFCLCISKIGSHEVARIIIEWNRLKAKNNL